MNISGCYRDAAGAVAAVAALALGTPSIVNGCGLEPMVNGGLTVSHPGALAVAVAVAEARSAGTLPALIPITASNEALLDQMLTDLGKLQSRLDAGRVAIAGDSANPFSLVLVVPGLWSHCHMTPDAVLRHYHVAGPLKGSVVVLIHRLVLEALLRASLTTEDPLSQGLLAFSGDGANKVRKALISGLESDG